MCHNLFLLTSYFSISNFFQIIHRKRSQNTPASIYLPFSKMGHPDLFVLLLDDALFLLSPFLFDVSSSLVLPVFWHALGIHAVPAHVSPALCVPSPHALQSWKNKKNVLQITLLCYIQRQVTKNNPFHLTHFLLKIKNQNPISITQDMFNHIIFSGSILIPTQ